VSKHLAIVAYLKSAIKESAPHFNKFIEEKTDAEIMRFLFHSFRDKDAPKGMRLSSIGNTIISTFFASYEIDIPEGTRLGPHELLFLDATCKFPYYIGRGEAEGRTRMIVFESELAVMLKMVSGDVAKLRRHHGR
jgi:hypothetical protein